MFYLEIIFACKPKRMHTSDKQETTDEHHAHRYMLANNTKNIVDGYLLAVFVGWFVEIRWNSSLIFTLHHLITIFSHELRENKNQNRMNDTMANYLTV